MTPHYPDLEGRCVAVTGAARGIGYGIAAAFAASGAHVLLIDVDADAVAAAAAVLTAAHPDVLVLSRAASVSDPRGVEDALTEFTRAAGGLDVVVNNAGISANAPSVTLDLDLWQSALDVNLTGVFVCSQAAARIMQEHGGGHIITMSSIWGVASGAGRAAYCVTKAGVASLTKVLAVEWADDGIRVNAIAPGYVDTDMVRELADVGRLDVEAIERRTPRGQLADVGDIANLALFLGSEVSANITGQVLVSDGGWTADGYGAVGRS